MTEREHSTDSAAHIAAGLVKKISRILAGNDPAVIGAALTDLTAMLVAGHHPDLREHLIDLHIKALRDLVELNEKIILAPYDGKWPTQQ